jgi:hypothetical protein
MARKRFISPSFFTHGALYDAEVSSGLPLRLAFAGIWTACDRRGLFEWKPRELKLAILPYDDVDFSTVLGALEAAGFITRYVVDHKEIGQVPSLPRWQSFHPNEKPSDIPEPPLGRPEPTNGRPEPESGRPSKAAFTAVAVTASTTTAASVAGAVADPSGAQAAPTPELKAPNSTAGQSPIDHLAGFLLEHDFGAFAPSVDGLIRSARNPDAIVATLRLHLAGEMGHEPATPTELGLACQQYLANGEATFKPAFFAGFVRRTKRGMERTETRARNSAENQHIKGEERLREEAADESKASAQEISTFKRQSPDRFAELMALAEREVPTTITMGRDIMVRTHLLRLVRRERPAKQSPVAVSA